jgi:hypothetical protein
VGAGAGAGSLDTYLRPTHAPPLRLGTWRTCWRDGTCRRWGRR